IGRSYTVASGMTSRGEPWRFELTRGTHFRNGAATGICFAFVVGTQPNGFGICAGGAPRTREPGTAFGTGQRVSRHDRRRLLVMTVPRGVALVRIRFHSGRTLSVRPLEIDRARAKATGVPFPLGVVLVAFAHHDSV